MKYRSIILALLCASACSIDAVASCTSEGISVFPHHRNIGPHSMFVIEGYARTRSVVAGLNTTYPVYLQRDDGRRVPLRVTDRLVGQYNLTQAVLIPDTDLAVGHDYDLVIDGLPDSVRHKQLDSTDRTWITASFTVVAERDSQPPTMSALPAVISTSAELPGCGPSTWVRFSNPVHDASEIIIKTTVRSMLNGKETTYYVEPADTTIDVGRDMCSGAFTFRDGNSYTVTFTFIDCAGNATPMSGAPIAFTVPSEYKNIRMKR